MLWSDLLLSQPFTPHVGRTSTVPATKKIIDSIQAETRTYLYSALPLSPYFGSYLAETVNNLSLIHI